MKRFTFIPAVLILACAAEPTPVDARFLDYTRLVLGPDKSRVLYYDAEHLPRIATGSSHAETSVAFESSADGKRYRFPVDVESGVITVRPGSAAPPLGPGRWFIGTRPLLDDRDTQFQWAPTPGDSCVETLLAKRDLSPEAKGEGWQACGEAAKDASAQSRCYRAAVYFYKLAGQLERALRTLERAERIDTRGRHHLGITRNAYYRGHIALEAGRLDEARIAITDALESSRRDRFHREEASVMNLRVRLLRELGHFAQAADAAAEALAAQRRHGKPVDVAHALNNLAWVRGQAMLHGVVDPDWDAVAELLRDSETRFTAAGDSLHAEMARANRAWAYWRAGADAEAAKLVEEMRSSTVAVRGFRGRISGELALDRGDWRRALLAFQQVSDLTLEHSLAGDDLFHARIGIARAHLRAGAHGRSAQALDAALRTLLERGVQTLIQQDRASYFGSRSGALRTIADEALAQGALDIGFLASVALVAAPYRALGLAANRRSMAADAWREQAKRYQDARDALDDIEDQRDFVRSEALPRWRSSRDAARRTVRATFEDLYRTLARAEPDAGFLDVNKLRRTLRSDEALIVNSAATSVSLTRTNLRSGELSSLLKTVADGHVYLVSARTDDLPPLEHGTLSLVPDPALLLRPEGTRPGTTLVIADPRNDLPFARREGAMASERLSAEVTLTGSDATRSAVTQSLSGAGFVHFSGHSEFVPDDVWNSSLLLANRDKLTALDVMALRPPARLVVLSGCESGNTIALAKGVSFGLAEAFLLAGASTVVATREALDDASTVKHVERFYRRAGLVTPAAAVSGTPFVVFGRRHVAQ